MGAPNPQIGYGEDVISRLNHVQRSEDGGQVMAAKVQQTLNEMLGELLAASWRSQRTGGRCLHRRQHGDDPSAACSCRSPNWPKRPMLPPPAARCKIKAAELGLEMAPGAAVYIPPCIGGFVGADHVAMILACDLDQSDKVAVGIDIGTNSEITLHRPGMPFLNSVSCASGPAFEGAHIADGMRAATGAIEKVRITEDGPRLKTIDDAPGGRLMRLGHCRCRGGAVRAGADQLSRPV